MKTTQQGLSELGIFCNLSGGNVAAKCPECSPTRKHKSRKSLSVRADGDGFLYNCHNCGWRGKWTAEGGHTAKIYSRPKLPEYAGMADALSPAAVAFLQSRKIPVETANANGLYVNRDNGMLAFPYSADGEIVAVKYRSLAEKRFSQEAGCRRIFYGLDGLRELTDDLTGDSCGFGEIVFVEGEMDKLAVEAAGWRNVLSVPDGGGAKDVTAYVTHAWPWLSKATGFLLALDNDEPGDAMAAALADKLGRHRCKTVRFACKDANETLMQLGADEVLNALHEADALPVNGVWDAEELAAAAHDLFLKGAKPGLSTGWSNLDAIFTVGEHCLTVVTGYPNNGKSEWLDGLAFNLWKKHGWKFAIFSPESEERKHLLRFTEKLIGKPASAKYPDRRMTAEENREALKVCAGSFRFLRFDGDEMPALDPILGRAAACVTNFGVKGLIIDPYNEVYQDRKPTESETDYVSRMLSEIKRFSKNFGVHVFFVAHPRKPESADTDAQKAPGLFSISGSQNWANKADNGISVRRMKDGNPRAEIHVLKVRDKNHGEQGKVELNYDIATGVYTVPYRGGDGVNYSLA
jgi:twinkle protein